MQLHALVLQRPAQLVARLLHRVEADLLVGGDRRHQPVARGAQVHVDLAELGRAQLEHRPRVARAGGAMRTSSWTRSAVCTTEARESWARRPAWHRNPRSAAWRRAGPGRSTVGAGAVAPRRGRRRAPGVGAAALAGVGVGAAAASAVGGSVGAGGRSRWGWSPFLKSLVCPPLALSSSAGICSLPSPAGAARVERLRHRRPGGTAGRAAAAAQPAHRSRDRPCDNSAPAGPDPATDPQRAGPARAPAPRPQRPDPVTTLRAGGQTPKADLAPRTGSRLATLRGGVRVSLCDSARAAPAGLRAAACPCCRPSARRRRGARSGWAGRFLGPSAGAVRAEVWLKRAAKGAGGSFRGGLAPLGAVPARALSAG